MKLKPAVEYKKQLVNTLLEFSLRKKSDNESEINLSLDSNLDVVIRRAQIEAAEAMREEAARGAEECDLLMLAAEIRTTPIE